MAISSIGGLGNISDKTVGSVGADHNTKIQDLLKSLESGSGSNSSHSGSGGGSSSSSGGGCAGGCCNCAGKTSDKASRVSGA